MKFVNHNTRSEQLLHMYHIFRHVVFRFWVDVIELKSCLLHTLRGEKNDRHRKWIQYLICAFNMDEVVYVGHT